MATLETMVQEHPVQQPAIGTDTVATQIYSIAFDPDGGVFWLFEDGNPLPPPSLELVVTENTTPIVLNAVSPLAFASNSALTLLPVNTPGLSLDLPPNSGSSLSFTVETAPKASDVFGLWLSMNYGLPPSLINLTTPYFFITPGTIATPESITLNYDTTTGAFSYGDALENVMPLQKLQVFYRLGHAPEAPATPVPVTLVSAPDPTATFADPAILWSDGTTIPRDPSNPNLATLSCPFVSGRAIGMQFSVSYAGGIVNSPDPIIMDKQIGDNGQP